MARTTLNLGILAHVDAGKTTLTERLLYGAGVIDELGSVDAGTTQTDTLALERRRGITIKAAVVAFEIGDVRVNLIDTPGHPDFIAEVERVLSVLDGAVLVVSAVEGVQPQSRILMRALQRLRVPTLVFVNKIDRAGADAVRVVHAIANRLTPALVPMGSVANAGTRAARFVPWRADDPAPHAALLEQLVEHDDELLRAYVDDGNIPSDELSEALATQTRRALVHPVFFGSALTGAGIDEATRGIVELLPPSAGDSDGAVSGQVFKIDRDSDGARIAYVRMFSGSLRTRDRVSVGDEREAKITAIEVFEHGSATQRPIVSAGEIARVRGLAEIAIGDRVGDAPARGPARQFPPPTFETVVFAGDSADEGPLRIALAQLAEQDPLIDVRQDPIREELSVSLYGEVQKQVLEATLADDFGIDIGFRETTTICVERPGATGEAVEILHADSNPFAATIGLRIEAAPAGSGIEFLLDVDARTVPMYAYKRLGRFGRSMEEYVRGALQEGLYGWRVTDCVVTMTECTYQSPDGPPATRGSLSTPSDFRKLTPIVVMQALENAGSVVCEPVLRVRLEVPPDAIGAVLAALARLGAAAPAPSLSGELATLEAHVAASRAQELQRELPGLTGGEGVLESDFGGYEPVPGEMPVRRRRTPDPRNREEYLMHLARRVG